MFANRNKTDQIDKTWLDLKTGQINEIDETDKMEKVDSKARFDKIIKGSLEVLTSDYTESCR